MSHICLTSVSRDHAPTSRSRCAPRPVGSTCIDRQKWFDLTLRFVAHRAPRIVHTAESTVVIHASSLRCLSSSRATTLAVAVPHKVTEGLRCIVSCERLLANNEPANLVRRLGCFCFRPHDDPLRFEPCFARLIVTHSLLKSLVVIPLATAVAALSGVIMRLVNVLPTLFARVVVLAVNNLPARIILVVHRRFAEVYSIDGMPVTALLAPVAASGVLSTPRNPRRSDSTDGGGDMGSESSGPQNSV